MLDVVDRLDQEVRRQPLQQRRGRDIAGDRVRHVCHQRRWRDGVFGISPDRVGARHPIPHLHRRHVVTDRRNGAAHLAAEDERQLVRVHPRPEVGVDEVDPDGIRLDQHLPLPR